MSVSPMDSPGSGHCSRQATDPSSLSSPNTLGAITTDQTKAKPRRPQASIGLGIITTNLDKPPPVTSQPSKTDAFFSTTTNLPTPRPPPALTRRSLDPPESTHSPTTRFDSDDQATPRSSFADRMRNLAASMNSAVSQAPSPIPNALGRSSGEKKTTSPTKASHADSVLGHTFYSDDDIMPLPSPAPGFSSPSSHSPGATPLPKHGAASPPHLSPVTPSDRQDRSPPASASIPILALSPSFPLEKNKLPSLSEDPLLGDMDDHDFHARHASEGHHLTLPMTRESKFASPTAQRRGAEEDMTGKQLGDYNIRRLLGVGAFSKVYLADRAGDSTEYAIKLINKVRMVNDTRIRSSIEREVGVLKFIDHPSIVKLVATMETEQHLCIVMEYARGGELFAFVQELHAKQNSHVDEQLVKAIFVELVKVVQWMHQHNIVHRDLKLENILIDMDAEGHPHIKVTDFGLARVIDPNEPTLTTRCGSEEYAAPEIVQGRGYDGRQTDTWALGIILYALLVGYLPFMHNPARGERVSHLFYRIVSAQVKWPVDWTKHTTRAASQEARQVVERILVRNPDKRITLEEVLNLPWFTTS